MATTTTTTPSSILEPEQQQQATSEAVSSSSAWKSSGSVGPFFAVISVLTVFAVISCYLSRRCRNTSRAPTPLESITGRGCFGWVKRVSRKCICTKDVEVGAKVMVCDHEENDCKVIHGEVVP
ncbi:hypothetical protein Lal_00040906 [Lupinus albus]|uniref:Uncharacterized protein n=1 Tax=Lupinus albus TaxID=3870 RepID=A0A6A5NW32_LUPAL|nr:hypothetical protein Lalb_Chr13g0302531 [Lupinus albus]KAF1887305.1 hypothetical protein Lal_00040906 [Lupinus albus]